MANECLVTKLKGVVNNDNLLKMGEFVVKNIYSSSGITETNCAIDLKNCTVRVNNGGYFATSFAGLNNSASRLTEFTVTNEQRLYFSNGDYDIMIGDKYNLSELYMPDNVPLKHVDLNDIKYCTSLTQINCKGGAASGDIANLINCNDIVMVSLNNNHNGIYGDISVFNSKTHLYNIQLRNNAKITGNISNLVNLSPSLSILDLSGCKLTGTTQQIANLFAPYNTNINLQFGQAPDITGDIVNLASMTKLSGFYYRDCGVMGILDELIEALRPNKTVGDSVLFDFVGTQVKYHASDMQPISEIVTYTF